MPAGRLLVCVSVQQLPRPLGPPLPCYHPACIRPSARHRGSRGGATVASSSRAPLRPRRQCQLHLRYLPPHLWRGRAALQERWLRPAADLFGICIEILHLLLHCIRFQTCARCPALAARRRPPSAACQRRFSVRQGERPPSARRGAAPRHCFYAFSIILSLLHTAFIIERGLNLSRACWPNDCIQHLPAPNPTLKRRRPEKLLPGRRRPRSH